jgi:uncharacterized membrane protein (UPF0127 family)
MIGQFLSQRKMTVLYSVFLLMIPFCICFAYAQQDSQTAIFETDTGQHTIMLEIAKTDAEKTKGLMYRKHLDDNAGMVFLYDTPTNAGIWMKNTYIPLDIIFINCDNRVVDCVSRKPHTLEISAVNEKICRIIEVNAGFCKKNSVQRNQKVNFLPSIE